MREPAGYATAGRLGHERGHCLRHHEALVIPAVRAPLLDQRAVGGVTHVVFGDLFLADIRAYREAQLAPLGLTPVFPLWQRDTRALAHAMIADGLAATLTCVDPRVLDRRFAGRVFDRALLSELPPGIDPCGENGEFHTFATDGPMFAHRIEVSLGEIVERDGFVLADLVAGGPAPDRPAR